MPTSTHSTPILAAEVVAIRRASRPGAAGEQLAADHLVADGLVLLARNWRVLDPAMRGELDIVAVDPSRGVLVVCEVKTRRNAARFGGAIAAVDHEKVRRLRRLTAAFLAETDGVWPSVRIDVVAIDLGGQAALTHLEGAA